MRGPDSAIHSDDYGLCRRRLRFAGDSRFFFDRLFGHPCFGPLFTHQAVQYAPRVPDVIANLLSDGILSLKGGRLVPHFGDPRPGICELPGPFEQHPRYLDYWHDPTRNSLVGLHLGIDLICNGDEFYVVELNLDAAIRSSRRTLYDSEVDPIISGVVRAAAEQGFKRVVLGHRRWSSSYRTEIQAAGARHGIECIAAGSPHQDRKSAPLPGLPVPLKRDTFYVFFHGRHTGLNYYIHNKEASAAWLAEELVENPNQSLELRIPRSSPKPFIPNAGVSEEFPNLVVKLSGSDRGHGILMGRFSTVEQVQRELGIGPRQSIPTQYRTNILDRAKDWLLGSGTPVYQEFIPPQINESGLPWIWRIHALVTPTFTRFLSAHKVISSRPVTGSPLPLGLLRDPSRFVVNFSQGAFYQLPAESEVRPLEVVTEVLGDAIRSGISKKFLVHSNSEPSGIS